MKKYSIVIPTYNHCEDLLKPCIESILNYSSIKDIEIIISANGCTDGTQDYVNQLIDRFNFGGYPGRIKLVWNDEPLGYTKATNEGIKQAEGEYVVLLNNDTEVLPSWQNYWLDAMAKPFEENSKVAITGSLTLFDHDVQAQFIVFCCAMIRRSVFDDLGLLDEIFSPGYGEDIDFAMRARKAGYEVICIDKTEFINGTNVGTYPLVHKNNKTFGEIPEYGTEIVRKNRLILRERYNKVPEEILKFKVGVITPAYNEEKFISKALDSVNYQTFPNTIHYIYNDNGTDNTVNIIKNYKTSRKIVLVEGDTNKGQSNARNVLIDKCINDGCTHIAFLDADDKWSIEHLEQSLLTLKDNDVVYSKPIFNFENGELAFPIHITVPREFIGKHLKYNNFIWISSVVAKTDCFLYNKFDDELNSVEDWDMWCRLTDQNYKFVNKKSTTVTYIVKIHGGASQGHTKMPIFAKKHSLLHNLKLNVACGNDYEDSYINLDFYPAENSKIDLKCDVKKLPYEDNSVDEIKAFHIIEHFDFYEGQEALKEWYRVLKPGGKLCIETPNFLELCKSFIDADDIRKVTLYSHFFAHPWVPGGTHKFLFTETQLRAQLSWVQFQNVVTIDSTSKYSIGEDKRLFLTIEAYK